MAHLFSSHCHFNLSCEDRVNPAQNPVKERSSVFAPSRTLPPGIKPTHLKWLFKKKKKKSVGEHSRTSRHPHHMLGVLIHPAPFGPATAPAWSAIPSTIWKHKCLPSGTFHDLNHPSFLQTEPLELSLPYALNICTFL